MLRTLIFFFFSGLSSVGIFTIEYSMQNVLQVN